MYTVDRSKTKDILMDYLVQEKAKTWKLHLDRTQWQSVAKECPQKIERTTVVGCFYYRDFFDLRKKIGNDRKACIQVKILYAMF